MHKSIISISLIAILLNILTYYFIFSLINNSYNEFKQQEHIVVQTLLEREIADIQPILNSDSTQKDIVLKEVLKKLKPLFDFSMYSQEFKSTQDSDRNLSLSLLTSEGLITYSTEPQLLRKNLSETISISHQRQEADKPYQTNTWSVVDERNVYFITSCGLITDTCSWIVLINSRSALALFQGFQGHILNILILSVSLITLVTLITLRKWKEHEQSGFYDRLKWLLFVIMISSGSSWIFLSFMDYQSLFNQSLNNQVSIIELYLKERLYQQPFDVVGSQLVNLQNIVDRTSLIQSIRVFEGKEQLVLNYSTSAPKHVDQSSIIYDKIIGLDLAGNDHIITLADYKILLGFSGDSFKNIALTFLAKIITITLVALFVFYELSILITNQSKSYARTSNNKYVIMRPTIFLFVLGIDLSISFLPLHMENIYQPLFGITKDVVMGLPISAEFLLVGIAILIAGSWIDRKGWRKPLIFGLILGGLGTLYSAVSPNPVHLILSRAMVGTAYGLVLMSTQGFVIFNTDDKTKTQGLAHLIGGIYAGNICGGAIGGVLAESFDYQFVFLLGMLFILFAFAYVSIVGKGDFVDNNEPTATNEKPSKDNWKNNSVVQFLSNRNILSIIFLSSLPASIAAVGFINYFCPVYLNRLGFSEAIVGQMLLLFGVTIVYLGPLLGRLVDASENKVPFIFLGCILGSIAFLSFSFTSGLAATALAVFFLGLSNSLVLSTQATFALRQSVSVELGLAKAISIFRSTGRIGQMLGPITFSWLIIFFTDQYGIIYFGLVYLVMALLFLLFARDR